MRHDPVKGVFRDNFSATISLKKYLFSSQSGDPGSCIRPLLHLLPLRVAPFEVFLVGVQSLFFLGATVSQYVLWTAFTSAMSTSRITDLKSLNHLDHILHLCFLLKSWS